MKLEYKLEGIRLVGEYTYITITAQSDPSDQDGHPLGSARISVEVPLGPRHSTIDSIQKDGIELARRLLNESALEEWIHAQQSKS